MSQPVPLFLGRIARGAVKLDRPHDFARHVAALEGQLVEMVLRKRRTQRSLKQNARYWALLTVAARELGYDDPEDLHEGLAMKFLRLADDERSGLPRRQRTPKCTTAEFVAYADAVERYFLKDLHIDLSGWDEEYDRMRGAA